MKDEKSKAIKKKAKNAQTPIAKLNSKHGRANGSKLYGSVNFDATKKKLLDDIEPTDTVKSYGFATEENSQKYLDKLAPKQLRAFHQDVVFVFDDVIGDIKKAENNPKLASLIMNRRHLIVNGTISIIVVTQKYSTVPSRLRSNATWLILFKLSPQDYEFVYDDAITLAKKTWHNVLLYVFGSEATDDNEENPQAATKTHDNLGIWIEHDVLFKNFEQLILK